MRSIPDIALPCKVQAVYSWGGEQDDDLGFIEGDLIEVDSFGDGNWWHGKLKRNKMTGNFPSNFVKVLEDSSSTPPPVSNTALKKSKSPLPVPKKKIDSANNSFDISNNSIYDTSINSNMGNSSFAKSVSTLPHSYSMQSIESSTANNTIDNSFASTLNKSTSFTLSPGEIEQQIQQLKQIQQLQLLQSEIQKKNQIAHSLSTPQNLNLLVNQLNDFYVSQNRDAAAQAAAAHTSQLLNNMAPSHVGNLPHSHSASALSSNHSYTQNNNLPHSMSNLNLQTNLPHSMSNLNLQNNVKSPPKTPRVQNQYNLPHSMSMPMHKFNNANVREFSNTSTLKPTTSDDDNHSVNSDTSSAVSGDAPPPPPPPVHRVPIKPYTNTEHVNKFLDVTKPFYQSSNNTSFVVPYDPDTLNQSRSDIHDFQGPVDDSSSVTNSHYFNSNESVTSSVSTAITDFSATSAGSYYRHKVETGLPPIPDKTEGDDDDELKESFMKSRYYRRVSEQDHFELKNSKGNLAKLNDGTSTEMPRVVPGATNPLDVIFVEEKKNKKSTAKFLKKLFLKDNPNIKTNPLNTTPISSSLASSNTPQTLRNNNFADLSFDSADSEAAWIENKVDLNRAATISAKEYKMRQKRALENEKYMILEPQKLITDANSNEVLPISKHGAPLAQQAPVDFSKEFKHIDEFIRNLKHLPYISPKTFVNNEIAIKYADDLDRIRACYIFCTEKIHLIESNEIIDVRNSPSKYINSIFQSKSATVYQLAWLMKIFLDALKFPNELIVGYYKKPNEFSTNLTTNHVWNSVLINNEWRFIDCGLANIHSYYNPILKSTTETATSATTTHSISVGTSLSTLLNNSVYFLTKPLELIYTHIPTLIEQQHISPPLDSMIALALPSCHPQFFRTNLKIRKFNNSLTRLQGLEVFEMVLEVPKDVEVFCAVKIDECLSTPTNVSFKKSSHVNTFAVPEDKYKQLCLSQLFWKNNTKFCRIKSVLPKGASKGLLEIYSGAKGLQKSLANVHPLSLTIPIYHTSINGAPPSERNTNNTISYRELSFVTRYPTVHCQQHDLYVKEPQIKNLMFNGTYIFKMLQHPSQGLTNSSGFLKTKLALQSPTGRIIKLKKKDLQTPYGEWEASVNCNEVGLWKGLVVTDGGVAWCVFAEWMCR